MKDKRGDSISAVASRFGLSRSTLLHYDQIGLLKPALRDANGYRRYSGNDCQRLQRIVDYRKAGLSLDHIAQLLDGPNNTRTVLLEQRLQQINRDIAALRQQQQHLVRLLDKDSLLRQTRIMTKQRWTQLLRDSGLSDEDMRQWHIQFEHSLPEQHQDFLESLGIDAAEIQRIRQWSRDER
ncbi:MAG: MerR family transcriptional regulator [Wenzhouxiangellaceae bacterium]